MNPIYQLVEDPLTYYHAEKQNNWVLIEVSSPEQYHQGHIPGAIALPWQATMNHCDSLTGLPPADEDLQQLLYSIAYNPDNHYWVYDHEGGGWAGRLIWLLHLMGHQAVSYINGGKQAWLSERLPLEREQNALPFHSQVLASINLGQVLCADNLLLSMRQNPNIQYWDARSLSEYLGLLPTARRNGHIPNAIHCEWTELMDQQLGLRIRADSADVLRSKGFALDRPTITYCQSNHRSGFAYLVGKHLQMDIQPYAGSWSEWGNREDTPIATAPQ